MVKFVEESSAESLEIVLDYGKKFVLTGCSKIGDDNEGVKSERIFKENSLGPDLMRCIKFSFFIYFPIYRRICVCLRS